MNCTYSIHNLQGGPTKVPCRYLHSADRHFCRRQQHMISSWMRSNRLQLNASETEVMCCASAVAVSSAPSRSLVRPSNHQCCPWLGRLHRQRPCRRHPCSKNRVVTLLRRFTAASPSTWKRFQRLLLLPFSCGVARAFQARLRQLHTWRISCLSSATPPLQAVHSTLQLVTDALVSRDTPLAASSRTDQMTLSHGISYTARYGAGASESTRPGIRPAKSSQWISWKQAQGFCFSVHQRLWTEVHKILYSLVKHLSACLAWMFDGRLQQKFLENRQKTLIFTVQKWGLRRN